MYYWSGTFNFSSKGPKQMSLDTRGAEEGQWLKKIQQIHNEDSPSQGVTERELRGTWNR